MGKLKPDPSKQTQSHILVDSLHLSYHITSQACHNFSTPPFFYYLVHVLSLSTIQGLQVNITWRQLGHDTLISTATLPLFLKECLQFYQCIRYQARLQKRALGFYLHFTFWGAISFKLFLFTNYVEILCVCFCVEIKVIRVSITIDLLMRINVTLKEDIFNQFNYDKMCSNWSVSLIEGSLSCSWWAC